MNKFKNVCGGGGSDDILIVREAQSEEAPLAARTPNRFAWFWSQAGHPRLTSLTGMSDFVSVLSEREEAQSSLSTDRSLYGPKTLKLPQQQKSRRGAVRGTSQDGFTLSGILFYSVELFLMIKLNYRCLYSRNGSFHKDGVVLISPMLHIPRFPLVCVYHTRKWKFKWMSSFKTEVDPLFYEWSRREWENSRDHIRRQCLLSASPQKLAAAREPFDNDDPAINRCVRRIG